MSELEEVEGVGDESLLKNLEKLTIQFSVGGEEKQDRSNLDPKLFLNAANILRRRVLQSTIIDEDAFPIIIQTFRFLRNAVAGCKRNQDLIRDQTDITSTSNRVLDHVTHFMEINGDDDRPLSDLNLVLARCTLQFLMNFMVDNLDNAHVLLSSTVPSISELLKRTGDEKIIEYAAMNLHTLLKLKPDAVSSIDSQIIVPLMLDHTHLEFVMYLIETLCTNDQFMVEHNGFPNLGVEHRVKLVRVIIAHTELHEKFSTPIVTFFSDQFKQKSDLIFKSQLGNDDWTAWEIASLLELLCCLSALDNETNLKTDSSLFTTVIFLLKSVHSTRDPAEQEGNTSSSSSSLLDFSPISDIAAMKVSSDTEEMRSRPTFQFKAHLIRLLANLIHRNFSHQEIARETEILPVILDSCKIDARNPFITQWAVLAVRNACEGNPANQELVRSVQKIDTKKTLTDPKVQLIGL